jgi:hypothetical protein
MELRRSYPYPALAVRLQRARTERGALIALGREELADMIERAAARS